MISASGWLAMLLWASEWAYPIGAVGTLLTAWMVGRRGLRALGWISGLLMAALVAALLPCAWTAAPVSPHCFHASRNPFSGQAGRARCLRVHEPCTGHWGSMPLRTGNGAPDGVSVLGTGCDVGRAAYAQRQRIPAAAGPAGRGVPHRAAAGSVWTDRLSHQCGAAVSGGVYVAGRRCCAHWTGRRRGAADPCVPH